MKELQRVNLSDLITKVEDCQTHIDASGADMVQWGIKQGEYLSRVQGELKAELVDWNDLHPRKEREQHADTKPIKYEAWCDDHVSAEKVQRSNYLKLYKNSDVLTKNVQRGEHFSSIRSALSYIKDTPERLALESMTEDERENYWKKKNEAEDKKKAKSAAKKTTTTSVEVAEYSEAEFLAAVRGYIPAEHMEKLTAEIEEIPDIAQMLFIQGRSKIMANMTALLKPDKKRLISALADMAINQALSFDLLMRDKPKYHKREVDRLKAATVKMKEKTAKLTADNVVAPIGSFTAKEYKQVLSVLHPDRDTSKERKTNAFKVFKKAFGSGR